MNSKFCSDTVISQEAYDGLDAIDQDLFYYDPNNYRFPRTGSYENSEGLFFGAWDIIATEGYDTTRSNEWMAMTGQMKADEGCLIEFEYHDFQTSENTNTFCCQAFEKMGMLRHWMLVNSWSVEDSTEEIW